MSPGPDRLAVAIPSLEGGGAERVVVNLLHGFRGRGLPVDLLVVHASGPLLDEVPEGVRILPLRGGRVAATLPSLIAYLRRERPVALLSHLDTMNVIALLARRLAGVPTRVAVTTHVALSRHARAGSVRQRLVARLAARLYPSADSVIGVSEGVVEDLERRLGSGRLPTRVIYNPIVTPEAIDRADRAAADVVRSNGQRGQTPAGPIVLSVGRMTPQKNHRLLVEAFACVAESIPGARLVILGDGREREALESLVARLGLADRVELPGWVDDPADWYATADAFVLSSDWEGLPTVLIEALLHGCAIVSTDCPSGPGEILAGGQFGRLVPPGDVDALAAAIGEALASRPDRSLLRQRALAFHADRAVNEYLEALLPGSGVS